VGGKHFVIDVSRNGAGSKGSWCNPAGAAFGQNPHVTAGTTRLDALLWVKTPGASDGRAR
jgi:endoglucanase